MMPTPDETPAALLRQCPVHGPTPLLDLPTLAAALGLGAVLVKDEGRRLLGSFKALGGVYAGLRALSRASGVPVAGLMDVPSPALPMLVCASDGNHGLAVAAAARLAGARARVYLPAIVPASRVARIVSQGAEIVHVPGTFDDAGREAANAAREGGALLVADTGDDLDDPVVADVMAGYGVLAAEIVAQLGESRLQPPTHLFVQAGVGGLAAAMATGLHAGMAAPARIVVVEPGGAACVGAALGAGRPVAVPGSLETAAEMLSCGEASALALAILRRHGVEAMTVTETALLDAPGLLAEHDGPATTASGAAGLAGLRTALVDTGTAARFALDRTSRVLLLVTEAVVAPVGSDGPDLPGPH